MTYLSAWMIVAAIAIACVVLFGPKAGYGLVAAVIGFVLLSGAERLKEALPK